MNPFKKISIYGFPSCIISLLLSTLQYIQCLRKGVLVPWAVYLPISFPLFVSILNILSTLDFSIYKFSE